MIVPHCCIFHTVWRCFTNKKYYHQRVVASMAVSVFTNDIRYRRLNSRNKKHLPTYPSPLCMCPSRTILSIQLIHIHRGFIFAPKLLLKTKPWIGSNIVTNAIVSFPHFFWPFYDQTNKQKIPDWFCDNKWNNQKPKHFGCSRW